MLSSRRSARPARTPRHPCLTTPSRPQGPGGSSGSGAAAPPPAARPPQPRYNPDVWASKPAWCQPWTILATGAAIVGGAWAASGRSPLWACLAALPVGAWWYQFLGVMPAQYREYAEAANTEAAAAAAQQQPRP
ncbi:MAG: hypothetical protein J3K34DRAFT_366716 [Monoraphidium minutum]|nr:MAG: hypothetical protein J3K34DRAFT_366716 [Monoraphidium minutum]